MTDMTEIAKIIELHAAWLRGEENGRKADLRGADLSMANLREADLRGADLRGADLSMANLREADLRGADLRGADLSMANLREADLYGSDLYGADLRRADLRGAKDCFQFGPMPTSGRICIAIRCQEGWKVQAGCFYDYLPALENRVMESHKCQVYLSMIELLKKM